MPFGDGTGPMGQGPRTGRGVGYCAGYNRPGYADSVPRRGIGFGRGRGWRRWGYYPQAYSSVQPTAREEKEVLTEGLKSLKEEIKIHEDRLGELKKKK